MNSVELLKCFAFLAFISGHVHIAGHIARYKIHEVTVKCFVNQASSCMESSSPTSWRARAAAWVREQSEHRGSILSWSAHLFDALVPTTECVESNEASAKPLRLIPFCQTANSRITRSTLDLLQQPCHIRWQAPSSRWLDKTERYWKKYCFSISTCLHSLANCFSTFRPKLAKAFFIWTRRIVCASRQATWALADAHASTFPELPHVHEVKQEDVLPPALTKSDAGR